MNKESIEIKLNEQKAVLGALQQEAKEAAQQVAETAAKMAEVAGSDWKLSVVTEKAFTEAVAHLHRAKNKADIAAEMVEELEALLKEM